MLNFDLPYPSRRAPVLARNVVATSQPLATQAGLDALAAGGNAVDAALAAAITLTVVEPCNNGVGSDAFAQVWDGETLHGLNASGRSPAGWTPERFAGRKTMPQTGWDTVTVPGAVSAWAELSERFGRLPFERLFDSARHYAEHGFHVGAETAWIWELAGRYLRDEPGFAEHFLPVPKAGELFRRPALARTLATLAEQGAGVFYEGELAERIVAASAAQGGCLRFEDLRDHRVDWLAPLGQSYGSVCLHELPPNGQGLAALIALGILGFCDLDGPEDERLHLQLEAMKLAIRASFDHFADPEAMHIAPEALLDPANLRLAAASIGKQACALPPAALPLSSDTVYLCAADDQGMQISLIQSNFMGFGSGVVVPETGISLQNRGSGFNLKPGHPNEVGPRKRPFHTIIPGFVTEAGQPRLCFGVMGGHMQHQGHLQMVHRIFDQDENPQAAIDAPRWQVDPDYTVSLEQGFDETLASRLEARGHRLRSGESYRRFGGAQMIYSLPDGYLAASDPRKEGCAGGR